MDFEGNDLQAEERIFIELLGKELLIMPHAYERMVERGICLEELLTMLESPSSSSVLGRHGRIRITNGRLTAVLQLTTGGLYLVTTYRKR